MQIDTPVTRALSAVIVGLTVIILSLHRLDFGITKDFVIEYIVIPIGAVIVAASVWSLVSQFIADK